MSVVQRPVEIPCRKTWPLLLWIPSFLYHGVRSAVSRRSTAHHQVARSNRMADVDRAGVNGPQRAMHELPGGEGTLLRSATRRVRAGILPPRQSCLTLR